MRRVLILLAAAALLLAPLRAQEEENLVPKPDLWPVAVFNQHLYDGPFSEPRGICYDAKNDEVWVADTRNGVLGVFTPDGVPLYTTAPNKAIREPSRLAANGKGLIYLLDADRTKVKVLNYRGELTGVLKLPGLPDVPVIGAIAVDSDGNLWVGENTSGRVVMYDAELKPRLKFGENGEEDGEFKSITGIAVTKNFVVVVDHIARPVQLFDRRGNLEKAWGKHDMGLENFSLPEAVAVDSKGRIVVIDALRHEIKFFDRSGRFLDRFGSMGDKPGQVLFPVDVAIDAKDRLFIVEKGGARAQAERITDAAKPTR